MKTLSEVVSGFPLDVQRKFDFSNATYNGALLPITGIRCEKHGEFRQYAGQLRKGGAQCPKCGEERRVKSRRLDPQEFLFRAEAVHPNKFLYCKTQYVNMKTVITVTCKEHGDFTISPIKLIHDGQGCPSCASRTRGFQKDMLACRLASAASKKARFAGMFIERARQVHGDLYDYSQHGYVTGRHKVRISCKKHGVFEQAVYHHLAGQGCPNCGQKSKEEANIARFLSIFTKVESRNRTLIAPKEIDIFLPEKQIGIEYCGMYWHSHGSQDEERKDKMKHAMKYKAAEAAGVRLLTIYETEWLENQRQMKRLLRNAIGAMRGKLMARKCELGRPTAAEARAFYDKYHPQGGTGHGEHFGLYWNGKLVACMRFVLGANDRGHNKNRVWTLGRYATRVNVAGAASKLFKAFVAEFNPPIVKSFSDNRLFGGGMYEQLGFELEEHVAPDYQVWSQKAGLRPKPHYQRRQIPRRLEEHGVAEAFDPDTDPRTEAHMTYLMGARRIYDCGKKRWVWSPTQPCQTPSDPV